jgi:uncharacterized Ntn-hydrolase superfamily protein
MSNQQYEDWDSIIIQLNHGENAAGGNIRMMRQDIEAMAETHGTTRGEVMEMMVQALEEQAKLETSKEDAVS